NVKPGEPQKIKFASEIFQPGPDEWNEHHGQPSESSSAHPRQSDKQAEPKRQHRPKRNRRPAENRPEESQMRRINRVTDDQPEVERLSWCRHGRQLEQAIEEDHDEKAQRRETIGQMERSHGTK